MKTGTARRGPAGQARKESSRAEEPLATVPKEDGAKGDGPRAPRTGGGRSRLSTFLNHFGFSEREKGFEPSYKKRAAAHTEEPRPNGSADKAPEPRSPPSGRGAEGTLDAAQRTPRFALRID